MGRIADRNLYCSKEMPWMTCAFVFRCWSKWEVNVVMKHWKLWLFASFYFRFMFWLLAVECWIMGMGVSKSYCSFLDTVFFMNKKICLFYSMHKALLKPFLARSLEHMQSWDLGCLRSHNTKEYILYRIGSHEL